MRFSFQSKRAAMPALPALAAEKRGSVYDTARQPRRFQFVPLWGIAVFFVYAMRRVDCISCGVKVETVSLGPGQKPRHDILRMVLGSLGQANELEGDCSGISDIMGKCLPLCSNGRFVGTCPSRHL